MAAGGEKADPGRVFGGIAMPTEPAKGRYISGTEAEIIAKIAVDTLPGGVVQYQARSVPKFTLSAEAGRPGARPGQAQLYKMNTFCVIHFEGFRRNPAWNGTKSLFCIEGGEYK